MASSRMVKYDDGVKVWDVKVYLHETRVHECILKQCFSKLACPIFQDKDGVYRQAANPTQCEVREWASLLATSSDPDIGGPASHAFMMGNLMDVGVHFFLGKYGSVTTPVSDNYS